MAFRSAALPINDAIVDDAGRPTRVFIDVYTALTQDVDDAPARLGTSVGQTAQTAAIGVTPFTVGTLAGGLYRVSANLRITQQATTSGSVGVNLTFTKDGQTFTVTGTTLGNTLGASRGDTWLVHIDGATPISYSTAYASVGGTPMEYDLDLVLEQVDA